MASTDSEKKKILVMDDEDAIRDITSIILTKLGYDPVTVSTGEDAISAYKRAKESGNGFSLVILDLAIPGGIGGREVIRELQQYDPQIRALVSSGDANDPAVLSYKEFGFTGVLLKPYNKEKLFASVSSSL